MEMPGALLDAEIAAQFLTLGGTAAYAYGSEPNIPIHEVSDCPTWGNLALWLSDDTSQARQPLPTYYAARLLTQQWAMSGSRLPHQVYRVVSPIHNRLGLPMVTAYAVKRPDGRWAVLLLNKDPKQAHRIAVQFQPTGRQAVPFLSGPVDLYQYSSAQYVWHPNKASGISSPDNLPPSHRDGHLDRAILPAAVLAFRDAGTGQKSALTKRSPPVYNNARS